MIEQSLSDQHIIDCLNTDYGIKVAKLTFLSIGADMNASVYKAETHDESSYFIKLKRSRHHDISATIIALLHNAGIQQIIPPIKTNHGQPIQHIDDFSLIVSPFVEGQDGFSRNLTDDQWVTLGKVMRQIDVFGDGTVKILNTPGHTPGHQSLELKLPQAGVVILSGDEFHQRASIEPLRVPVFNTNRADTMASADRIKRLLINTKGHLVVQHDAHDFEELPKFPEYLD